MVANHQGVRDQGGVTRRVRLRAGGRRPTQIFHKVPFSERGHLAARHRDFFPTTAVGHSVTSRHVCCRVQFFRCRLGATTPPLPQLAARSVSAAARSLAAITAAARRWACYRPKSLNRGRERTTGRDTASPLYTIVRTMPLSPSSTFTVARSDECSGPAHYDNVLT
jgi:hypothetical protein